MRKLIAFLLLSFLANCKSENSNEFATAKLMYDINTEELRISYDLLKKAISDAGNREKDVQLLSRVDSLQYARKVAGLKYNNTGVQPEIKSAEILRLLDQYLLHIEERAEKQDLIHLIDRCKHFLTAYSKTNSKMDLMYFLVNITQIEKLVIEYYSRRSSYTCGVFYSLNFNLYSNSDSLAQGSPFKLTIAQKPDWYDCQWEVNIDSLVLVRNDSILKEPYKFEKIGTVGYFEYFPSKPGDYSISGNYSTTYKPENHTFKEIFIKPFYVSL